MILELLNKRSSVRSFIDKPVPEDVINIILEAGRLSPSGGNEQPWLFGVITDKKLIKEIRVAAFDQHWIEKAPLLIVLCTTLIPDIRGGRDVQKVRFPSQEIDIAELEYDLYAILSLEEHQTKIPGSHMLLAALEEGVCGTWVSFFDVEQLKTILNLPEDIYPSEILVMGYPNGMVKPKEKKALSDITFYNKFKK